MRASILEASLTARSLAGIGTVTISPNLKGMEKMSSIVLFFCYLIMSSCLKFSNPPKVKLVDVFPFFRLK